GRAAFRRGERRRRRRPPRVGRLRPGLGARPRGASIGGVAMSPARWPRILLALAIAITAARIACDALGLRPDVTILCGMAPGGSVRAALGIMYVLTHLALVVVAPILAFAGCLGIAVHRRI